MPRVFTVDVAKCNGCYNCQIACKDEHSGNDWSPYSRAQPDIGHFWIKLQENVCGTIPKVKIHYIARLCNHCENPSCIPACPHSAIYRRDDGLVVIDPEICTGCGKCADACPYDSIYYNETLSIYQKCTGCAHLLDNGYAAPRCVEVCPTEALRFGERNELSSFIDGASVYKPETANRPNLYYRNIPGKFISGTAYDPIENEVIIGAKCRATIGGKNYFTTTDSFGDFWFNDLPVGKFTVVIVADGYIEKIFTDVSTKNCVNLGDIPLEKITNSEN